MNHIHTNLIPAGTVMTGGATATKGVDVLQQWLAAMTITVSGATSPSILCALQGSNWVPGSLPNAFAPPASTFQQVYVGGVAVTETITSNGVTTLASDPAGMPFRWVRLSIDPTGGDESGTIQVDVFARGGS